MIPKEDTEEFQTEPAPVAWATFLESCPSGTLYPVKGLVELDGPFFNITTPDIRLYCEHPQCQREQTFGYSGLKLSVSIGKKDRCLLHYTCRQCGISQRILSVYIEISSLFGTNKASKHRDDDRVCK